MRNRHKGMKQNSKAGETPNIGDNDALNRSRSARFFIERPSGLPAVCLETCIEIARFCGGNGPTTDNKVRRL